VFIYGQGMKSILNRHSQSCVQKFEGRAANPRDVEPGDTKRSNCVPHPDKFDGNCLRVFQHPLFFKIGCAFPSLQEFPYCSSFGTSIPIIQLFDAQW